jgi:GxxExxY protein
MDLNEISSKVIGAAIDVHKQLGPGLLESVYQKCMEIELKERGLQVKAEVPLHVTYKGHEISDDAFRIDLLIEDAIVVELKSVEEIRPVHKKQVLTYLRLAGKQLGLLINFNESLLKEGISRIANEFSVTAQSAGVSSE